MERDHTFDFLCGLCIIRMIGNHAIAMCGLRWYEVGGVSWYDLMGWTYFFMCFFFFKAGYFNKTVSGNSLQYVLDRTKRLLVPYITWSIVGAIVYFGMIALFPQIFDPKTMGSFKWSHLWETSNSYGNGPCWFLMSFYVSYLIVHFMEKVRYLHWIIIVFPFVSYWLYLKGNPLWLSLDNIFMGIFFFFLGRVWKVAMRKMGRKLALTVSLLMIAAFIVGNIYQHGEYTMSTNKWDGSPVGIMLNMTLILCGLSGFLHLLPQRRVPVINFIGQHSMVYFVAHYPLMLFYIYMQKAFSATYKYNWGMCIMLVIFLFITCTWLVPYVERAPWLSGRWKKKIKTE